MTYDDFMKIVEKTFDLNSQKMRRCTCGDPSCTLVYYDNGFSESSVGPNFISEKLEPGNVINVDFIKRRRI